MTKKVKAIEPTIYTTPMADTVVDGIKVGDEVVKPLKSLSPTANPIEFKSTDGNIGISSDNGAVNFNMNPYYVRSFYDIILASCMETGTQGNPGLEMWQMFTEYEKRISDYTIPCYNYGVEPASNYSSVTYMYVPTVLPVKWANKIANVGENLSARISYSHYDGGQDDQIYVNTSYPDTETGITYHFEYIPGGNRITLENEKFYRIPFGQSVEEYGPNVNDIRSIQCSLVTNIAGWNESYSYSYVKLFTQHILICTEFRIVKFEEIEE